MMLLFVLLVALGAASPPYYLNSYIGSDDNSCSAASPCKTFAHVFSQCQECRIFCNGTFAAGATIASSANVSLTAATDCRVAGGPHGFLELTGGSFAASGVDFDGFGGEILKLTGTSAAGVDLCSFSNSGRAIHVSDAQLDIVDCSFVGNQAKEGLGGSVLAEGSSIVVHNTTFVDGLAIKGGFIALVKNSVGNIDMCSFSAGKAGHNPTGPLTRGGAVHIDGSQLSVTDSTFSKNLCQDKGGAVGCYGSHCVFSRSIFQTNTAGGAGAAVYGGGGSLLEFKDHCMFRDNVGVKGCIYTDGGNVKITDVDISNNRVSQGMVAAVNRGRVDIQSSAINQNQAEKGGAIFLQYSAHLTLSRSTIQENHAQLEGGAIFCSGSSIVSISKTEFISNTDPTNANSIVFCSPVPTHAPCEITSDLGIGDCEDGADKPPAWSQGTILMICGTVALVLGTIFLTILIVKIIRKRRAGATHVPLHNVEYFSDGDGSGDGELSGF